MNKDRREVDGNDEGGDLTSFEEYREKIKAAAVM